MDHGKSRDVDSLTAELIDLRKQIEALEAVEDKRARSVDAFKREAVEWQATFDAIPDMVSVQATDGTLLRINRAYAKAYGGNGKEVVGRKCYEVVHGTKQHCDGCPLCLTIADRKGAVLRIHGESPLAILEASTSPIFDEDGTVSGAVHIIKDISERIRAEQDRIVAERLKGALEAAGAACHELNQPLQAILGYVELILSDPPEDDDLRSKFLKIREQATRMAKITRALGSMTRYETRAYVGETRIIDLKRASVSEGESGLKLRSC